MKKNLSAFILVFIASTSFAKTSYEKMPVPKKGGTFTDTLNIKPVTLNTVLASNIDDQIMSAFFYMSLIGKDAETYADMPALAEKVEVSKDKKEYTYTLNKNAKWSDGTPVTSDDVEFTFNKTMDPKVDAAATRSYMGGITFQKIDGLKFKFIAATPKFNTLSVLNGFAPIQKKQFENESDFNKSRENLHPIGNFAYKLKSISRDQVVILERDPNWWAKDLPDYRATCNFDTYQFKIIGDPALKYENFLKGSLDTLTLSSDQYLMQVQGTDKDKFGTKPNSGKTLWADKLSSSGSMPWYGFAINQKHLFMNSLKVRQALAYLIDYETIIERAFNKTVIQSISPFGSHTENTPPELKAGTGKFKYDPKKAAALLKEEGWADTDKDGILDKEINGKKVPFRIEFKTYASSQAGMKTAQIVKEGMKKAGIDFVIRGMDGTALYKDFDDKNFDLAFMGWGGGSIYPDAKQVWHTDSANGGGSNHISYSNKKVDELIEKSNLEFNEKKRTKMMQEIARQIYHDVPYIFIAERSFIIQGFNSKIKAPVWLQKYSTSVSKELYYY